MKTVYGCLTFPLVFPLTGILIARWFFGTSWAVSFIIWLVVFWIIIGVGTVLFRNDPNIRESM